MGSFSVNGVAHLHTELLKSGLFADFYRIWPEKFNNKTNGVTQRRWLSHCNPRLRDLLNETIGTELGIRSGRNFASWLRSPTTRISETAGAAVKLANKQRLADYVKENTGVEFDTAAMFDVQVKRIHEYKRQLLNCAARDSPVRSHPPR